MPSAAYRQHVSIQAALRNISQKWTMPIRDWKAALTRFTIQFGDRISVN